MGLISLSVSIRFLILFCIMPFNIRVNHYNHGGSSEKLNDRATTDFTQAGSPGLPIKEMPHLIMSYCV